MLVTRESATKQYEHLRRNKVISSEDKAVVETMLLERPIYRAMQNRVIEAIYREDRVHVWHAFKAYDDYRQNYITRTRAMHERMEQLEDKQRTSFYLNIILLGFSVVIVTVLLYLWDKYLRLKEEQRCL